MLVPVLLAGGLGTRLWPMSRKSFPKQFVNLVDPKKSLLQLTVERCDALLTENQGWIAIASNDHRFLIAEQLSEVKAPVKDIILEPEGKNTAPAIALAAIAALKQAPEPKLLIQSSDHFIPDTNYFCEIVKAALLENQPLMTFGVSPSYPETGYGYIKTGEPIGNNGALSVCQFIEKPDLSLATTFVGNERFLWNSGMFLLDAKGFLEELKRCCPQIYEACFLAMQNSKCDGDFLRVSESDFAACPSISVDVAVMEKSEKLTVLPFKSSWTDLGSWDAVSKVMPEDDNGNVVIGDGVLHDVKNTLIRSESRLVAAIGVNNLLIAETADAVVVANRSSAQDVREVVDQLRLAKRSEADEHRTGYKPWGKYDVIGIGDRFKVKKITVKPGKSLSLQVHKYRSEHWVVVNGYAEVIKGDKPFTLVENQSIYIPAGVKHRLTNSGDTDLILIEVQTGSYLGEDDIIRFEDVYGRV